MCSNQRNALFKCRPLCLILIEHAVLSCHVHVEAQNEFHSHGLIMNVFYWVYSYRHSNQLTSHPFHHLFCLPPPSSPFAYAEQREIMWTVSIFRQHVQCTLHDMSCSHLLFPHLFTIECGGMSQNAFCNFILIFSKNFPQSQINLNENLNDKLSWKLFFLIFQSVSIWLKPINKVTFSENWTIIKLVGAEDYEKNATWCVRIISKLNVGVFNRSEQLIWKSNIKNRR